MSLYTYDGSVAVNMDSVYKGKKISLLGDSITTYVGYIPSGQTYEYTGSNHGISSVNDTWWKKLIDALGMELLLNNSWTGTCVSTIRDSAKGTNSNAVVRSELLGENPDVIILYMGINDFCFEAPLGDYEGLTSVPNDKTTFSSAYAMTLDKMMTKYPQAEIWCATLPQCNANGGMSAPEINNNGVALTQFNERIRKLALTFGAKVLDFAQCGQTFRNLNVYVSDGVHPNAAGMSLLANQAIRQFDPYCRIRY